jgi:glucokinase
MARNLRGGIDLGGTKIEAVVVDSGNTVLGSARRPTPTEGGPPDVARAVADAITDAATAAETTPGQLIGVGIGSPGTIERTGAVTNALNLPAWAGETYPLRATLKRWLRTEVFVGNDVQVATEGEFHLGAGRRYNSLLGVFWGTGVGGGIVLDGKSWLGRGGSGEIGHMVVKLGGRRCPCGRRGCMEAYAGRAALERRARRRVKKGAKTDLFKLMAKHHHPRLTSSIWFAALKKGDKLAVELIDEAVEALGAGIASAVNLLDVEAVVIGGGLGVRFGAPMVERITKAMHPHLFKDDTPPAVVSAALGDAGGALGAALMALPRHPSSMQVVRSTRR